MKATRTYLPVTAADAESYVSATIPGARIIESEHAMCDGEQVTRVHFTSPDYPDRPETMIVWRERHDYPDGTSHTLIAGDY